MLLGYMSLGPAVDLFKIHRGHGAVDVLSTSHKKLGRSDLSGTSTGWFVLSWLVSEGGKKLQQ